MASFHDQTLLFWQGSVFYVHLYIKLCKISDWHKTLQEIIFLKSEGLFLLHSFRFWAWQYDFVDDLYIMEFQVVPLKDTLYAVTSRKKLHLVFHGLFSTLGAEADVFIQHYSFLHGLFQHWVEKLMYPFGTFLWPDWYGDMHGIFRSLTAPESTTCYSCHLSKILFWDHLPPHIINIQIWCHQSCCKGLIMLCWGTLYD